VSIGQLIIDLVALGMVLVVLGGGLLAIGMSFHDSLKARRARKGPKREELPTHQEW
jgi:hypothetical protein